MSVFCRLVVLLVGVLPAVAQSQAFEVITIKPHGSGDPRNTRMQVLPNGAKSDELNYLSREDFPGVTDTTFLARQPRRPITV